MEIVIGNILSALRAGEVDTRQLDRIIRERSSQAHDGRRVFAKKRILPFYLRERAACSPLWKSWNVDDELDARFVRTLQMKPRRTASGVATITVITKPWPCANNCVYCPNDPRMPKSYLSNEPACQRAERNHFHPYLQVASRLRTLNQMGHATDKVELIVLGGTWLDYPIDYQRWFIGELYRALNESGEQRAHALDHEEDTLRDAPREHSQEEIERLQAVNEHADQRVVGLVVETRPDTVNVEALTQLRAFGCTKIQLGVQSVNDAILAANGRHETCEAIQEALSLSRLFGFKLHTHFMVNLLGATPESDIADYRRFATCAPYQPDEVKLYPCALVANTQLVEHYENGSWQPYTEEELVRVLSENLLDTPAFTRVSRMIRDISARDILVGNKKTNLRQLVEENVRPRGELVREIRFREIGTEEVDFDDLRMEGIAYDTGDTQEHFFQWITSRGKIAGFLRLSLPRATAIERYGGTLPVSCGEAMIREVHVYGFATRISTEGTSAQHRGLGRALVERACDTAREAGYSRINVISAVGTRDYYRNLGFSDGGLYQYCELSCR